MKKPVVSLIMPLYNAQEYIERCIQCISRQTYKNIEVIFINDGSTDDTESMCQRYMAKLANVQLISTCNQGVSSARNTGIKCASGEYIAFADVDDYFFNDYIEYLVDLVMQYDADIAICDYKKQGSNEIELKKAPKTSVELIFSREDAIENVSYRKELSGSPYGKLISKKIVDTICFDEKVFYYEDYLYVCDAIAKSRKIVYGNGIKYLYLQHSQSATHQYDCEKCIKSWEEFMIYINRYEELYPKLIGGFRSKALVVSIDMLKRLYRHGYDETGIREYIHENSLSVAKDKKCTTLKRLLAFFAYINIDMAILLGKVTLKLLSVVGCEI